MRLYLLLTVLFFKNALAQTCADTTFRKQFYCIADTLKAFHQATTADNATIITGKYISNALITDGFAMRVNVNGTLLWSKNYRTADGNKRLAFKSALELNNGNFILSGNITGAVNTSGNSLVVAKTDATGNLVWEKNFGVKNNIDSFANIDAKSVKVAPNGDILIVGNTGSHNFFLKLDARGTIILSKLFTDVNNGSAQTFIDVFTEDNSIIIFGYGNTDVCSPDLRGIFILRLNANTAEKEDLKHYCFTRRETLTPYLIPPFNYQVKKAGNKYIVSGVMHESSRRDFMFARFDTALNFLDARTISNPIQTSFRHINAASDEKLTFIVMTGNGRNFYYSTVDKDFKLIRQRRLQLPSQGLGNNYSEGGQRIDFKLYASTFLVNYTSNGNAVIELMQLNNNDSSNACLGTDTVFSTIQPFTLYTSPYTFVQVIDSAFFSTPLALTAYNLPVIEKNICSQVSICNSVKILGQDTLCNEQQPVTYTARTNAGCSKRVLWKLDTALYKSIIYLNDSTVSILFKKTGLKRRLKLYAEAGSCGTITDSLQITILPTAYLLPDDTTLCQGDSLRLSIGSWLTLYRWQDGSTDSAITVKSPGVYWVTARDYCGNPVADTIVVSMPTVKLSLGADVAKCDVDTITLRATPGFSNYVWLPVGNSFTLSDSVIKVFPAISMSYSVSAQSFEGCIVKDTILVTVFSSPKIILGANKVLCKGDSVVLNAGFGFKNYLWNTGDTSRQITINNLGVFLVKATTDEGCIATDSLSVTAVFPLPSAFLPVDTSFCVNDNIIVAPVQSFKAYLWNNGATTPSVSIATPGRYWLKVTDVNNCTGKDSINIKERSCGESIFVPTAFTPDADGKNDLFKPVISGIIERYLFSIYNRWGQKIFETNDFQKGWDGTVNGTRQNTGVFVWNCGYKFSGSALKKISGTVSLIR